MRVEDYIMNLGQMDAVSEINQSREGKTTKTGDDSLPASWGPDSVDISQEGREALLASQTQAQENGEDGTTGDDGEQSGAEQEFGKFMDKAKGGTGGGGDSGSTDSIKARIKELQSKIAQISSGNTVPDETKTAMISALQAEIGQLSAQLSEAGAVTA